MSLISIFLICATIFNSAFTCPFLRFSHSHSFRGNTGTPSASHLTSSSDESSIPDYASHGASIPSAGISQFYPSGLPSLGTEYPVRGPVPNSHDDGSHRTGANDAGWENKILQKHNEYRAAHGAPAFTLDTKLSQLAQEWADKLGSRPTAQLEHRPDNQYGENIFWSSAQNADPEKAVHDWYKEKADYDPNNPEANFIKTGHFTQVVWKGSTKIGCGKSSGKTGTFIVCNYDPPGNVRGQYGPNVA